MVMAFGLSLLSESVGFEMVLIHGLSGVGCVKRLLARLWLAIEGLLLAGFLKSFEGDADRSGQVLDWQVLLVHGGVAGRETVFADFVHLSVSLYK